MKLRVLLFFSVFLIVGCQSSPEEAAIARQLKEYPQSRVQDIYKSFCQDYLGPEHLIPDPEYARNYLKSELAGFREDLDNHLYEEPSQMYCPVGDQGNYVRVDLSAVLKGRVSEDALLDAFVRSANEGWKVSPEEWIAKWNDIAGIIRKHFSDIPGAEQDLARLDSLIREGNLIMHHSPEFEAAYHPHYRIISKDIFESDIKPLID
ncbi:MAG: hypothetical protein J6T58_00645 [Bacteroidales bacterium]|nr:hypothetical protein [Bacteroidales bacterium]